MKADTRGQLATFHWSNPFLCMQPEFTHTLFFNTTQTTDTRISKSHLRLFVETKLRAETSEKADAGLTLMPAQWRSHLLLSPCFSKMKTVFQKSIANSELMRARVCVCECVYALRKKSHTGIRQNKSGETQWMEFNRKSSGVRRVRLYCFTVLFFVQTDRQACKSSPSHPRNSPPPAADTQHTVRDQVRF